MDAPRRVGIGTTVRAVVRAAAAALMAVASCESGPRHPQGGLAAWTERHLAPGGAPDLAAALAELSDAAAAELAGAAPRLRERLSAMEGFVRDCEAECSLVPGPPDRPARTPSGPDPRRAADAIVELMFGRLRIEPVTDPAELPLMFPDVALRERRGSCLGLAGLFLAACQRLRVPARGVLVPGHFFARYDDGRERFNVELLRRGLRREDAFYREHFRVPPDAKSYMRPLDARETLAVYLFNVANALREAGRERGLVARLYEAALGAFPEFAEARGNLGVLLLESGDSSRAAAELEKALAANPSLSGIHLDLGAARRALGDLDGAERVIRAGLSLEPESAPLLCELGDVEFARGRMQEALELYRRAVEIAPRHARAHRGLAALYVSLGARGRAGLHIAAAEAAEAKAPASETGGRLLAPW